MTDDSQRNGRKCLIYMWTKGEIQVVRTKKNKGNIVILGLGSVAHQAHTPQGNLTPLLLSPRANYHMMQL